MSGWFREIRSMAGVVRDVAVHDPPQAPDGVDVARVLYPDDDSIRRCGTAPVANAARPGQAGRGLPGIVERGTAGALARVAGVRRRVKPDLLLEWSPVGGQIG